MKPINEGDASLAPAPSLEKEVRVPTHSVQLSTNSFLGEERMSAYAASKFAVRGLTQAAGTTSAASRPLLLTIDNVIAVELGRYGITVNAYAPGPIVTDMRESAAVRITVIQLSTHICQS